ncbi:MAG TPA: hypothetical protein PKL77_07375 [Candidatus Omnitrophota bacterium]|nr:hypothetical protein [Candidatus Omnitrophota bacterium]
MAKETKWGEMLREFVEKTKVPKKQISDELGITPGALSSSFNSESLNIETIMRICHACDSRAYWFVASVELPKMPVEAFKILEEIFFLPQKKREFFLRQMIEIKKLMDEIEKEAKDSGNK